MRLNAKVGYSQVVAHMSGMPTGGVAPTAENVFWDVAGTVTLDTSAHLEGVMVAQTSIALGTSASIHGRLLAETAVTMADSVVVGP
jgi:Ice-binding-like